MTTAITEINRMGALLAAARREIGKRIIGQDAVVEQTLITVLAGGHGLLVGAPGLAKTRLVDTLGTVLGLNARRVQFTPDLMPGDILGSEILQQASDGSRAFRFIKGPIFCQLLMADEINRASPRTQSALLQAMQEHEVTIAGQSHELPAPFHVLATQNPIEQEGTYPLPEAQLDRFLLQIDIGYPSRDEERAILIATTGTKDARAEAVLDGASLMAAQQMVRGLPMGEQVMDRLLTLVRALRPYEADSHPLAQKQVHWGPGPRAAQALSLAARARALLQGRMAPDISDLSALALPVLRHRMAISFEARAQGQSVAGVISTIADEVLA